MAYGTLAAIADATKGFAIDLISGQIFTRTKISFGDVGAAVDVSATNPLPVAIISGGGGSGGGLTDDELRATPVPVSGTVGVTGTFFQATQPVSFTGQSVGITGGVGVTGTFWQATQPVSLASVPLPAGAATGALQTAGNASLTSIDGKFAALEAGRAPVAVQTNASTTRAYADAAGLKLTTAGAGQVRSTAITAAEIMLHAKVAGYVRVGDSGVVASNGAASFPLEAGEKFHMRITSGQFVSFIRDGATDGSLFIYPVA